MRWLADENLSSLAIQRLRELGHDVVAISESATALSDEVVLSLARDQNRILISFDRDFGDLIFHQGRLPPLAVVYLRTYAASPEDQANLVERIARLGEGALCGRLTVVTGNGLRHRPLP